MARIIAFPLLYKTVSHLLLRTLIVSTVLNQILCKFLGVRVNCTVRMLNLELMGYFKKKLLKVGGRGGWGSWEMRMDLGVVRGEAGDEYDQKVH